MARKKYLNEEDENEEGVQRKCQSKDVQLGKPFHNHNHHFLGGGTKNEYRHSNAKNSDDSDGSVGKQLFNLGLSIKEMPGDGNCLFRALSDQITGTSRNHLEYRRAVVQYMKEFRGDFEPFVEDDVPFDKYVQRLSQAGTFAGNDVIVAFARLHNVSVVIHQLFQPAWVIHPSKDSQQEHHGHREVHIFYHNCNHYNSVRRIGDDSESPTNIRLHAQVTTKSSFKQGNGKKSPPHSACSNTPTSSECYSGYYESKRDEDYWVKDSGDVERLVEEVMVKTNYPDPSLVRETLVDYNFDVGATIDFLISLSVVMNQHSYQEQNLESVDICKKTEEEKDKKVGSSKAETTLTELNSDEVVQYDSVNNAKNEDIGVPENLVEKSNISVEDKIPVESDDGSSSSPSDSLSSQETIEENISAAAARKEPKRSNRQKKGLKKRERKREADRRKMLNASGVTEKENQTDKVVMSHFGSLDI